MNLFGKMATLAVLTLQAAFPLLAAQNSPGSPVTLDQVMASLRTVHHIAARYIEHRTLHALRMPIEARGALRFDAPAHLEKLTDPDKNGETERLIIDGDRLTIVRSKTRAEVTFSLREHPEVGVLIDSIRATLAGDTEALRKAFNVVMVGTLDVWQMTLTPHDPAQQSLLTWMQISGFGNRITAIDTQDGAGDRSEMSIVELRP